MNNHAQQPVTFADALESMSSEQLNEIMTQPVEEVMRNYGGGSNGAAADPTSADPQSDTPEWKEYMDAALSATTGNVNKLVESINQMNGRVAGIESAVQGMPNMVTDIMRGINEGASPEELQQRTQRHQEAQQSESTQRSQAQAIDSQVSVMLDNLTSQFTAEMEGDTDFNDFRNHWSRARQALQGNTIADAVTGVLALTQADREFNAVQLKKERLKMQADFDAQKEQIKKEVMQEVQPENLSMPGSSDNGDNVNHPLARLARLGTDERMDVPNDEATVGLVLRDIGVGI